MRNKLSPSKILIFELESAISKPGLFKFAIAMLLNYIEFIAYGKELSLLSL